MNTTILMRLFLLAILLSSFQLASSQRSLINLLTWMEFEIPVGKQVFVDSLLANPLYDFVWPVEVDYLPDFDLLEDGNIEFTLPDYDSTLFVSASQVKFEDEDDFVWRGMFTGNDEGDMMMIEKDGEVYGYFFIDTTVGYELMDLGGHTNILVKYSPLYFDTTLADCAYENPLDNLNSSELIETRGECQEDALPIRILVYVSDAAYKKVIPEQKVGLFIEQLNFALDNSALSIDQIYFEIAAILPFSDIPGNSSWDESAFINSDLADLKDEVTGASVDPRDALGADLVCLLVDGNYDDCHTTGFAYQHSPGDLLSGFSIVEGDGGTKYSFAHEVAHNIGCGHQNNTFEPNYARSWHWKNNGKRKSTIMQSGGSGKQTRILNYTNPDVYFVGHVTGVEASRDNARQLVEGRDAVADNFCSEPKLVAIIKGPRVGINNVLYTWNADVLFCSNITNYKWQISGNGIKYLGAGQSSTMDELSLYLTGIKKLWIKLTVTCNGTDIDTDVIVIDNYSFYSHMVNETNITPIEEQDLTFLSSYPNPSNGEINLNFILKQDGKVSIIRTDSYGKSYTLHEGFYQKGEHKYIDSSSNSLNGTYYYSIQINNEILSTKTIIKH